MHPEESRTGRFQTTRWSLVADASHDPRALEQLLAEYWEPIYAFARRSGLGREDAADLVQEFISQRLLTGSLLSSADPGRGRFRTFVKVSLTNFLIDQQRRDSARRRAPHGARLIRPDSLDAVEPVESDDPDVAFDRQWAASLIAKTMGRVEEAFAAQGREAHWRAFERVIVAPLLTSATPPRLADLAAELGVESPERLSMMLQAVRRRFRRTLEDIIAETVSDRSSVPEEVEDLREFLRFGNF